MIHIEPPFGMVPLWITTGAPEVSPLFAYYSAMDKNGDGVVTVNREETAGDLEWSYDMVTRRRNDLERLGAITVQSRRGKRLVTVVLHYNREGDAPVRQVAKGDAGARQLGPKVPHQCVTRPPLIQEHIQVQDLWREKYGSRGKLRRCAVEVTEHSPAEAVRHPYDRGSRSPASPASRRERPPLTERQQERVATLREFFAGQERKLHYLEQIEQGNHSLLPGLWSEYQDAQPLERTG